MPWARPFGHCPTSRTGGTLGHVSHPATNDPASVTPAATPATRRWVLPLLAGVVILALVSNGITGWLVFRSRPVQPPRVVVVPALDPKAAEACQGLLAADASDYAQMTQIGSTAQQSSIALIHDAGDGPVFEAQQATGLAPTPDQTPQANIMNLVPVLRAADTLMSACVRAGYGGFIPTPLSVTRSNG
jgi:hypothetical protein